jgi:ribose 5-phosphate isomerase
MTDSVSVFPPGFRVINGYGLPVSGAKLKFFDSGTTTPKTVYSDSDLGTSLGSTVTCDSQGYPTSDGSTKCQVYVGIADYKVRVTTSADVTISEHDEVKGALDTSGFGDQAGSDFETPVVSKSTDYTVLIADQSKLFNCNCGGGDITLTLPSAVTAATGFKVGFRHAASANQVIIATVSSQVIKHGTILGTNMSLVGIGETVWLTSDGADWNVDAYVPPYLKATLGVIIISDIANSPPGSPVQGERCIVGSVPAGGFSTFAQHDVAEYTGNAWVKLTPPTDCGWLAYVQDEDTYYSFVGSAWVTGSTANYGMVKLADSTAMEALTASRVVTADVQHRHPGHPKATVSMNFATAAIIEDYGVSSITDNAAGNFTVNFDAAYSATTNYGCCGGFSRDHDDSNGDCIFSAENTFSKTTTAFQVSVVDSSNTRRDPVEAGAIFIGDQ